MHIIDTPWPHLVSSSWTWFRPLRCAGTWYTSKVCCAYTDLWLRLPSSVVDRKLPCVHACCHHVSTSSLNFQPSLPLACLLRAKFLDRTTHILCKNPTSLFFDFCLLEVLFDSFQVVTESTLIDRNPLHTITTLHEHISCADSFDSKSSRGWPDISHASPLRLICDCGEEKAHTDLDRSSRIANCAHLTFAWCVSIQNDLSGSITLPHRLGTFDTCYMVIGYKIDSAGRIKRCSEILLHFLGGLFAKYVIHSTNSTQCIISWNIIRKSRNCWC